MKNINEKSQFVLFLKLLMMTIWLGIPVLLVSCSVHNQVNKEDFRDIPKNFTGKFYDQLDTLQLQYDQRVYTTSFMKQLTSVENINYSKPIKIDIKEKELYLSFEDAYTKQYVLKFYGKRHKHKFVFYTNYETISFPIVFITKNVTRYSVFMPTEEEIMFENSYTNEGMFLIVGAGNSHKSDYKFKLLKNE